MNFGLTMMRARALFREMWPETQPRIGEDGPIAPHLILDAFKSDAEAIEEARTPIAPIAVLYAILFLLVSAILWASFGTTDRIVIARGKITTVAPTIVLQPFQTERIAAIHVHAGDHVKKGTPLISFDPAFAQADIAAIEAKYRAETAEQARIEAELAGRLYAPGANATPEERAELDLFARRTAERESELQSRDSKLRRIAEEMASNAVTTKNLKREVELAGQVLQAYRKLTSENAGVPMAEIDSEQKLLDAQMRLRELGVANDKLVEERDSVTADRAAFLDKWNGDLGKRLVEVRQDNAQSAENLVKARKLKDLTELVAPFDGVVLELADRSIGSVVKEAETLVTLVPVKAPLVVEVNIASNDVGYVKVGEPARVKLEAYPFQQFGTLSGSLEEISPDSVPLKADDEHSPNVFRSRVRLGDTLDDLTRRHIHLGAGLVATAEIKTGRRSIISYILYPIMRTFDEGLKEP